jgi:hypothetical protein
VHLPVGGLRAAVINADEQQLLRPDWMRRSPGKRISDSKLAAR